MDARAWSERAWAVRGALALAWLVLVAACGGADSQPASSRASEAASADAPTSGSAAPAVETGPRIAFLGDSLSAGLHVGADEAFPAVLQRRMADRGLPFRLINAGVSGDTTAGGVRRVDWLLAQDPDWVVVELGGNDGLRGVPLDAIERNLREIVTKVRAGGARALLLGMKLPPNYGEPYVEEFAALYRRIADDMDVELVPFFLEGVGGVPELNHPDGIHPTVEGHRRIAAFLEPVFVELVESADRG